MDSRGYIPILAFMLLYWQAGSFSFARYTVIGHNLPVSLKTLIFVLTTIGFGTKAGLIPLHIWLPKAHPAAPSNVSAIMSGVMLKTAIYGFIKIVFEVLGGGPSWWGVTGPVYDIQRFGFDFVASPRHADILMVTGPVTRNLEIATKKTFAATPAPKLVVAVGTCACSGGICGKSYTSSGGVDNILPVNAFKCLFLTNICFYYQ